MPQFSFSDDLDTVHPMVDCECDLFAAAVTAVLTYPENHLDQAIFSHGIITAEGKWNVHPQEMAQICCYMQHGDPNAPEESEDA